MNGNQIETELARRIADVPSADQELTLDQESAVVAERELLLMAIGALSRWTFEQIASTCKPGLGRRGEMPMPLHGGRDSRRDAGRAASPATVRGGT